MPAGVAMVLRRAAREAHAGKRAGAGEVWVAAVGEGLRMGVVGRGVGSEPGKVTFGRGRMRELRRSVVERGGTATVRSSLACGNVVGVWWKP